MPIHLPAPARRNGGPDGRGWNRIAANPMGFGIEDQCALRPRSFGTLWESQDTRRARWGGFGPCVADGKCTECPLFRGAPRTLRALDDKVLVRTDHPDGRPYLMNRPEDGWASLAERWTWQDLARLEGWTIGRRYRDEHGEGFWLERT